MGSHADASRKAPQARFWLWRLRLSAPGGVAAQQADEPFEPYSGQPGKDVVWVPTPDATVEVALNLAALTPQDYVIDLGSGDGRMVIAAARRGARGHGVEFNPKMVELSNRYANEAGVADRATFIEGDMYAADLSKASGAAAVPAHAEPRQARSQFPQAPSGRAHRHGRLHDQQLGSR